MKQWFTILVSMFGLWCFAVSGVQSSSGGPPPGAAGVPAGGEFSSEVTCASSECHNSSEANADALGKVELLGVPASYVAGAHYRLTFKLSHPKATRWGFQVTAVSTATMRGAGDFAALPNDSSTQRVTGGVGDRVYIEHGPEGRAATGLGRTGSYSWQFDWIAPTAEAGEIAFYGSGNAANGDGSPSGDSIYSSGKPLALSAATRSSSELRPVPSHAGNFGGTHAHPANGNREG